MPVERRGQVIALKSGQPATGGTRYSTGRRQPSRGGTSRMTRECQVRICERLGVQFPGPTRQFPGPTRPGPPCRDVCVYGEYRRVSGLWSGWLSDRQLAGAPWWAPIVSDIEGPTDFDRVGICFETEISRSALDSCMA